MTHQFGSKRSTSSRANRSSIQDVLVERGVAQTACASGSHPLDLALRSATRPVDLSNEAVVFSARVVTMHRQLDVEPMQARTIAITLAMSAAAVANVGAQSEAVPAFKDVDSIEARVQGCATCHGQSGQGTNNGYFPRIAGKPAAYLYNQLVAFRDGNRRYPPMNYLVAYLPDNYLREMAEHFAKQRPPFAARESASADAATTTRGQSLVTAGDASKGIPACIACHGAGLTGMEPGIPGLVGLRPN